MNLVVQGQKVETRALKDLATLTGSEGIGRLGNNAFRLRGAQPHPDLAAYCEAISSTAPSSRRPPPEQFPAVRHRHGFDADHHRVHRRDRRHAGPQGRSRAITEAAMRGELDFRESLTRRVALLEGLPERPGAVFANACAQSGRRSLIAGLKKAGIVTVLVSGGFTYFTDRLQKQLGFDYAVANELEIRAANSPARSRVR
jgi:phosphoserine phosphatase